MTTTDEVEADFGEDPSPELEHLDTIEKEDVGNFGLTIAEAEEIAPAEQNDPTAPQGNV